MVRINGKNYMYFAGTSYFNLHNHPEMILAAKRAMGKYGLGAATSRSLTGTTPMLEELEKCAAGFFNAEDAAYLPSGYLSNMAGLRGLEGLRDFQRIFLDEFSHYSLRESALASGKAVCEFRHRDPEDLREKLRTNLKTGEKPLIASDGLFPVAGQVAPAGQYLHLAGEYDGRVWLDDAHASGILGETGKGTAEELGLKDDRLYSGTTLSKAFGAYGGLVAGTCPYIEKVRASGAYSGTNSPLSAAVAAALKGLKLVAKKPFLRVELRENASFLKKGLAGLGLPVIQDSIPIASFAVGNSLNMMKIQERLMDAGIYIQYTSYRGAGIEGMLRIIVTSTHEKQEIEHLHEALAKVL